MSASIKKWILQIISFALVGAVFYYIGRETYAQWDLIRSYEFKLNWPLLILASGVYSIAFLFLAGGWWGILHNMYSPIKFTDAVMYFFLTLPCKYVPGKIWTAVGRTKLCKKYSLSTSTCFVSTGIEGAMETFAGIYISLFALITLPDFGYWTKIIAFLFVALGLLMLIPRVYYFCINIFLRLTKQPAIVNTGRVGFKKLLILQVIYGIGMFLMGVSQVIFLTSLTPIPMKYIVFLVSMGTFSYVASILAFFTPGGLGVREGIWYIALKNIVVDYISLIFALVSRLWSIILEALLAFIALGFFFLLRRNGEENGENRKVPK